MIPIDLTSILKVGGLLAILLSGFFWLQRKLKKAEQAEVEKNKNEMLNKINYGLVESINNDRKEVAKYEELQSDILNSPDSVDTWSLLNSHDYGSETKEAGQVQ